MVKVGLVSLDRPAILGQPVRQVDKSLQSMKRLFILTLTLTLTMIVKDSLVRNIAFHSYIFLIFTSNRTQMKLYRVAQKNGATLLYSF